MGRTLCAGLFACIALALLVAPASAEDQGELEKLRQEVKDLKSLMLEQDINSYLDETEDWKGVQGGGDGMRGVTIHAAFTANFIGSLGADRNDIGVLDGSVDVDFDFQVTENVALFVHMTANNGGTGTLPTNFATTGIATPGSATLSGALDGIGVDGTVPTNPGAVTTNEAGIRVSTPVSNGELHWEMGEIDPRSRFLQNAFANDNYTQFLNNLFNDSPSVPWLTDSTGRTSLGWHLWMELGANKQFTVNVGWFNTPGQWFQNGQLYFQLSWKGEVQGRAMNIRVMGFYSEHPAFEIAGTNDESVGGGVTWDWMVTDKIGVFVTIVANNSNNLVPTNLDATLGAVWHGVGSRADDRLGAAIGFIDPNDDIPALATADTEFVFEVYYTYAAQDGKLLITPYLQFVTDPGGGTPPFTDDSLFLVGVRIHVPF